MLRLKKIILRVTSRGTGALEFRVEHFHFMLQIGQSILSIQCRSRAALSTSIT